MALGKKKLEQVEQLVSDILDVQDVDILVVRPKDHKVLYMNAAARTRMETRVSDRNCKSGYSCLFPDMCDHCPSIRGDQMEFPHEFDTEDSGGRQFSVTVNKVQWIDGKPAYIFFLKDVDEERATTKRLYELAYMDSLTEVPNRRKFREDFEKLEQGISQGRISGLVAIFDLDNFKVVNDTYGHSTGDLMLKRLAEHIEGDVMFSGHIYRLGGDEFAMLYSDPTGKHENFETYYGDLLQGIIQTYSMPNIEMSCTISMGVAFFPKHGETYSELLRKADIALYQAKQAGRNRLMLFEDKYDLAKKFRDVYVNIQPILNESGQTFGYELLDGGSDEDEREEDVNLSEFNRAVDTLGLEELSSDTKYFITHTDQMLDSASSNYHLKKKFVIELSVPENYTENDLKNYKKIRGSGYSILMCGLTAQSAKKDVLSLADYVKFDRKKTSDEMQKKVIAENPKKRFIATDIDSISELTAAKKLGYKLFQGFYFNESRPVTTKTKEIEPLKVNYFRLLQLTSTDDYVDFGEISEIISSDVALSYKLLRLLNSAALALPNRISSISMAVAYLGEENLKKWISLLGMRGVAGGKPLELVRMSLIRARFGELLAPHFKIRRNEKHVFLVGLLSLLHIAMDKPKEELMDELPLAEDIRMSILTKGGLHSDLLEFFKNYEYANWEEVNRFASEEGLTSELINDSYLAAVKWCNDLIDES